ncbi:unnamed protein product, partial [Laminaria digitata]
MKQGRKVQHLYKGLGQGWRKYCTAAKKAIKTSRLRAAAGLKPLGSGDERQQPPPPRGGGVAGEQGGGSVSGDGNRSGHG